MVIFGDLERSNFFVWFKTIQTKIILIYLLCTRSKPNISWCVDLSVSSKGVTVVVTRSGKKAEFIHIFIPTTFKISCSTELSMKQVL